MSDKTFQIWFLFSVLVSGCYAQDQLPSKYGSVIDTASAKKHLEIIASDEFEGRETGKKGADKAADYIADQFKLLGLAAPVAGSYFQPVALASNKFNVNRFIIGNDSLITGTDFLIINSSVNKTVKDNEIVFIGYGITEKNYDDLKDIDITDKIVLLINEDEPVDKQGISRITGSTSKSPWSSSNNKRIQHIISKNPKVILAASKAVDSMLTKVQKASRSERIQVKEDLKVPASTASDTPVVVYIPLRTADLILSPSGNTYQDLKNRLNNSGKPISKKLNVPVDIDFGIQTVDVKAQNVLGYMEGTDLKDELLIITAHYDHIGVNPDGQINNGADDDGSGVTGVLEIANAFSEAKKAGHGPRRSILFMTVTGEEKGLLGSDYYTRYPIFPLANTIADLNIDMIGRIDPVHFSKPNYVYLVGSDKLSSELHTISEKANQTYTKLALDYKYNDPADPERIYYRSDHYNFAKHKIPVIFYFNGVHEDYHNIGDTVDKIDFGLLTKRSQLVFYTAWDLVNREKRPIVDSDKK